MEAAFTYTGTENVTINSLWHRPDLLKVFQSVSEPIYSLFGWPFGRSDLCHWKDQPLSTLSVCTLTLWLPFGLGWHPRFYISLYAICYPTKVSQFYDHIFLGGGGLLGKGVPAILWKILHIMVANIVIMWPSPTAPSTVNRWSISLWNKTDPRIYSFYHFIPPHPFCKWGSLVNIWTSPMRISNASLHMGEILFIILHRYVNVPFGICV